MDNAENKRESTVNSFITFVLLAVGLGMASVNLSLPLVNETGYVMQSSAGLDGFMLICLSMVGIGLVMAYNAK